MSRTLEVFEHGILRVADVGDAVRPSEFEALIKFNDRHSGSFFEIGHNRIKAKNYVGYVEVGDLSIEILPKADKGNAVGSQVWRAGLIDMLQVALGLDLHHVSDGSQQLTRGRLLDLIARAYATELEVLIREGFAKGYRTTESNGVVFRGRLKIAEHLRENIARADRFFVEYQTFDHEIPINQVLAAALDTLMSCALSSSVAWATKTCLARFPELRVAGVTIATVDRIRLTRATQRYAKALIYARMILAHQNPNLRSGGDRVFAMLFDMNLLWERYIATLLRRAAPSGIRISTQELIALWLPHGHSARSVKPDIVVSARSATLTVEPAARPATLLVIDTKWKVPDKGPSEDDLKQMFVYNELFGSPRSILLYPQASLSTAMSGVYSNKEHRCEQMQVGVLANAQWSSAAIKAQLAQLVLGLVPATHDDMPVSG